ncbi:hypothetical protein ACROYT_G037636 [Oculina patagonica]
MSPEWNSFQDTKLGLIQHRNRLFSCASHFEYFPSGVDSRYRYTAIRRRTQRFQDVRKVHDEECYRREEVNAKQYCRKAVNDYKRAFEAFKKKAWFNTEEGDWTKWKVEYE